MAIESKMHRPVGQKKETPWLAITLAAVVVAAAAFAWWWFKMRIVVPVDANAEVVSIPSGSYQAVFLDNGQVYFGKLAEERDGFSRLTSVYYMQVRGNPQNGTADPQATDSVLVKLGSEVHGPADFMDINVSHILFTEDLTGDSKVSKAIADYVSKQQPNP